MSYNEKDMVMLDLNQQYQGTKMS